MTPHVIADSDDDDDEGGWDDGPGEVVEAEGDGYTGHSQQDRQYVPEDEELLRAQLQDNTQPFDDHSQQQQGADQESTDPAFFQSILAEQAGRTEWDVPSSPPPTASFPTGKRPGSSLSFDGKRRRIAAEPSSQDMDLVRLPEEVGQDATQDAQVQDGVLMPPPASLLVLPRRMTSSQRGEYRSFESVDGGFTVQRGVQRSSGEDTVMNTQRSELRGGHGEVYGNDPSSMPDTALPDTQEYPQPTERRPDEQPIQLDEPDEPTRLPAQPDGGHALQPTLDDTEPIPADKPKRPPDNGDDEYTERPEKRKKGKRGRPKKAPPPEAEDPYAVPDMDTHGNTAGDASTAVKGKRGRPRKTPLPEADDPYAVPDMDAHDDAGDANTAVKGKRGRPRKATLTEVDSYAGPVPEGTGDAVPIKGKRGRPKKVTPEESKDVPDVPQGDATGDNETALESKSEPEAGSPDKEDPDGKGDSEKPEPEMPAIPDRPVTPAKADTPAKAPDKGQPAKTPGQPPSWMASTRPPLYRVGLSRRSRIAPLLKSVRK